MSEHPIQGLMGTAMQSIKEMVDVNTIIGDPITTPDGTTIIPISKVSFGFASGGSDFAPKGNSNSNTNESSGNNLFGGGSGAGISITPVAFLVVNGADVRLLHVSGNATTADRVVSMLPDVIDKIKELFGKKSNDHEHEVEY